MQNLVAQVQHYAWGLPASTSLVAKVFSSNAVNKPDADTLEKPFAELWIGTHVNGPAIVKETGKALSEELEADSTLVGDKVQAKFGATLPFLLKILSVNTALSVQAHPDKKLAEQLHADRPAVYKDPNHKPELVVALTPYRALCNFRPYSEIAAHFAGVEELRSLCSSVAVEEFEAASTKSEEEQKTALREVFSSIMKSAKGDVDAAVSSLISRISATPAAERNVVEEVVVRLSEEYPMDVGIFCPFLLNIVDLQPGEGLYMGANEPHAYLHGQGVEIMATSDNVVRAGLTPKLRDVEVLCSMLTYKMGSPAVIKHSSSDEGVTTFEGDVDEFILHRVSPASGAKVSLKGVTEGPKVVLVTNGSGEISVESREGQEEVQHAEIGTVLFVPHGCAISVQSSSELVAFVAAAHPRVFK